MPRYEVDEFAKLSGPFLGLDHGSKTIGLAVSNRKADMATPLYTLKRTKQKADFEALKQLIEERGITGLILGYPVDIEGNGGPRAQSVRAFGRHFLEFYDMPLLYWDERFSTQIVEDRLIHQLDMSRSKRAERIDALAAQHILQNALDHFEKI